MQEQNASSHPALDQQISEPVHQPQYTDPKMQAILMGSLTELPAMPTKTVRIFLSSTFSGNHIFIIEGNTYTMHQHLMNTIYKSEVSMCTF